LALAACSGADSNAPTETTTVAFEPTGAESEAAPMAGTPATPVDAASYISKAGAGDLWEIESSKALLAKSTNSEVKAFAQMMIDHHGKSTAQVKAAAGEAQMTVSPPGLDAEQRTMLAEFKAAEAATIDAIYLSHQKNAHEAALALHQGFAASGDTAPLKKSARAIVPVIETHRTELAKLTPAH
jgi:putative membrane protein